MKRYLLLSLSLSIVLCSITAEAGTMYDYTSYPLFMSTAVKPNVIFLLDNSGSMKCTAYRDFSVGNFWGNLNLHNNYNSSTSYYGYFDSASKYSYNETDGYFYVDASGEWDGNFLNWSTMRRVDVARRVLIGGKVGINERNQDPAPDYYLLLGQNEPEDRFYSKYISTDDVTPCKANSILTVANGKVHLSRFSVTSGAFAVLEVGRVKVNSEWQTISFENAFSLSPVLVAKPAYHNCSGLGVRLQNVTATGFQIKVERFDGGSCNNALVTYMAVESGTHNIGTLKLEADFITSGSITGGNNSGSVVSPAFSAGFFTSTPVVLSSINTAIANSKVAVTRNLNVTTSGFDVFMQEGEGETGGHGSETIGWIAIESGSDTYEGETVEVGTVANLTDSFKKITFASGFDNQPFFLADMQTSNESDTASLRLWSKKWNYKVKVLEEKSGDTEIGHSGETLGYVAISMPSSNIKVRSDELPTGVIHDIKDKVRLGLAVYNYDHNRTGDAIYTGSTANGGTLCPTWRWEEDGVMHETPTHVKAPTDNIIRAIEEYPQIWGTTPTAETLYEVMNYLKQTTPYFPTNPGMAGADLGKIYDVNDSWDPYYYDEFDADNKKPSCAKSFIVVIGDGEPYRDFTYTGGRNSGNLDTAMKEAVIDPLNVPPDVSGSEESGASEHDFVDDLAWYLHTKDLRPDNDNDVAGKQTASVYSVLVAFGDYSETGASPSALASMRDNAVNGGFEDKNGDDIPTPTHPSNWGTWSGTSSEWDEDDNKSPDNFYLADDGAEMKVKLVETITDILKQTASSTAASVLSTTGEAKGVILQAYYKPLDEETEAAWLGYLKALWVDSWGNLREDSNHPEYLDVNDANGNGDHIIQFILDDDNTVIVYKYLDGDDGQPADGIRDYCQDPECHPGKEGCDDCSAYEASSLDDLKAIWEAGEKLESRDPSTREIYTWVDLNNNSAVDAGEFINFNVANAAILRPFLGAADTTEAENIIKFIRGEYVAGYRNRSTDPTDPTHVWKLGDIVNATPTVVGRPEERMHEYYSDESYGEFYSAMLNAVDRPITVYAGANDGMLHSFNAGKFTQDDSFKGGGGCSPGPGDVLGAERWGYIPQNLLPHLRWLTDPDYTHVNYIDLKPRVTDARVFTDDVDHPNGWGTILVGGMRFGGGEITLTDDFDGDSINETRTFRPSYFCMDITDPRTPNLLWEKTHEKMGFTTSFPGFVRLETTAGFQNPEDDEWFCVFGSGPTTYEGTSNQSARIFILDLATGEFLNVDGLGNVLPQFVSSEADGFMGNPVTIDYQLNYNDDFIYVPETYDAAAGASGKGKMLRISTRGGDVDPDSFSYETDPDNWVMSPLTDKFRIVGNPDIPLPPITSSANASVDKDNNLWIYFGTGKYVNSADKGDTTPQYFLGVIDEYWNYGNGDVDNGDLQVTNLLPWSNVTDLEINVDGTIRDSALSFKELVDGVKTLKGWFIELGFGNNAGERLLTKPSVLGGNLFFTSFKPVNDICSYGGESYLYALYYETGTAYTKSVFKDTIDGKHVKAVSLDRGKASDVGLHMSNAGRSSTGKTFIQQSSGVIVQMEITPALRITSGIYAWQQL